MPFTEGSRVGPYVVVSLLGAGGMGEVYRAHDPRLGRDIALKVIRRALVDHEDALDRLLREAVLASALNHPNIVTIYETGTVGEDRYIAMELVEGRTLRQLASEGIALERVIAMARQVAEALAVAHAAQIIHRDVKPDNIVVRPDGYVKLLDFGLAKFHLPALTSGSTAMATDPGLIVGTVAYMSPEQARGENATPESDVFAFGVMLYELATGRHPFSAASQLGTLHAVMWETPEPPSLIEPELPRAIDQLILEMLQKDARLRPGMSEVLYRLGLAYDSSVATTLSSVTVTRRDVAAPRAVVGRDLEMDALQHEFGRVLRGAARFVVLSAEAGMGKTTLLDAFVRMLQDRGEPVRIGRGRCSERLAGSEAYLPVLEALDSLQRNEQLGSLSRLIRALAPSWYVQIMPPTENDSSAARLAADTAGGSQERLKREILALLEEVSRLQPVVLCFDDMHWADPSTTDLLAYLGARLDHMRVLVLATARPSELAQARHPFLTVTLELAAHGVCREIALGRLDQPSISRYLALQFPENTFPQGFAAMIHERTEGHPLFVVDLLRDLRRRQVLAQKDGRWVATEDLPSLEREVPQSVRSLVQRKMDALDEQDRLLLSAASVQGLDFDAELVAGALEIGEAEAEDRLERLEREHALVRFVEEWETPNRHLTLRYRFAHHLYQNAFYETLRPTRRIALARAIAERMVIRNGDEPCECAADIALLFETGREPVRAAEYWNRAAQASARLYAHDETTHLAQRGLALLASEPESPPKAAAELGLQMTYGLAVKTSRGYAVPEVGAAYARARQLSHQVNDPARVIPVLIGLSAHHIVAGEIETSRDIALEMLDLFNRLGDPNLQMLGHWSLGAALFHLGELEVAHDHMRKALDLYDPSYHKPRVWETGIDPGVFCRCEFARATVLLGHPDQGLATVRNAVAEARALENPQTLAFALLFQILVFGARRQPKEVIRVYDELSALCAAHGIAQEQQWTAPLRGRALVELGQIDRGLPELAQGLEAHALTRSALMRPFYFVLYAGGLLRARRIDAAEEALRSARDSEEATRQRCYMSERWRLQAEVHVARGQSAEAEAAYRESLAVARAQGARWLELRSARAYATFLLGASRPGEARAILQPIVEWFTEGFETLDYAYADALLKTLA